jgi:hypothetical protein
VSSALACVGLAVSDEAELDRMLKRVYPNVREVGFFDGVHVGRWQDDSGAALILGLHALELVDFSPVYSGTSGGLFADCRLLHESIAYAKVVDSYGHQLTAMAFEAEQYRQLRALGQQVSGAARITALGTDVSIYPDEDAYADSPASQIRPSPETAPEPPPHHDGPWPTRLAAEFFISYGLFADIARNRSRARMSGTVLRAASHVCALTGQPFIAAEVRTAGFTADLCLAAGDHADMPVPGNVISGTVVLSASIDAPT